MIEIKMKDSNGNAGAPNFMRVSINYDETKWLKAKNDDKSGESDSSENGDSDETGDLGDSSKDS
jgi:hypothetical protein